MGIITAFMGFFIYIVLYLVLTVIRWLEKTQPYQHSSHSSSALDQEFITLQIIPQQKLIYTTVDPSFEYLGRSKKETIN